MCSGAYLPVPPHGAPLTITSPIPHKGTHAHNFFYSWQVTDSHNRTLRISHGHLMYAGPRPSTRPSDFSARPAFMVHTGDYVWSRLPSDSGDVIAAGFGPARVVSVTRVPAAGMVAPFTLDGTLVVDGVLASSYATYGIVSAETAHAMLAPVRWMWHACPAALRALHTDEGDSPALLAAGLGVLNAVEKVKRLV